MCEETVKETAVGRITRPGYDLVGWYWNNNGSEEPWNFDTGVTQDLTLTAKWRKPGAVKIIYQTGTEGTLPANQQDGYSYATDSTVVVAAAPTINTGVDATFIYWELLDKNGNVVETLYPNNSFNITNSIIRTTSVKDEYEVYLRAKYEITGGPDTPSEKTTITYNSNYTGGPAAIVVSTDENGKPLRVNVGIKVKGENTFTREGYKLIGWDTNKEAEVPSIGFDKEYVIGADNKDSTEDPTNTKANILYAIWEKLYKVTYEFDSATPDVIKNANPSLLPATMKNKRAGSTVNVSSVDASSYGYTFNGWKIEGQGDYVGSSFTMPKKDVRLVGYFTPINYTVTYVFTDESTLPATVKALKPSSVGNQHAGDPFTATDIKADAEALGYVFSGWSSQQVTVGSDGKFAMPASNVTLTGYFTKKDYTVTYEFTDYATLPDTVKALLPKQLTGKHVDDSIPAQDIKKAAEDLGYTFSGWSSEQTTVAANGAFTMPASDVTLTGSFTAIDYTVTYEFADGTPSTLDKYLPNPATLTGKHVGDTIDEVVIDSTADGYDFLGWKIDGKGETVGTFQMPPSNVTLIGSFQAKGDTKYHFTYLFETLDSTAANPKYAPDDNVPDVEQSGETDTEVPATTIENFEKTYTGFTFKEATFSTGKKAIIKGDGSLVITLYYTRNTYTVTYKYADKDKDIEGKSDLPTPNPSSYKFGERVKLAPDASAPGYDFDGWEGNYQAASDTEGQGSSLIDWTIKFITGLFTDPEAKGFEMPAADVTIIGSFTAKDYTVTYKFAEGSPAAVADLLPEKLENKHVGEPITVEDITEKAAARGYEFSDWTADKATIVNGKFNMPADNVILTGSFTEIDYTVTYKFAEGSPAAVASLLPDQLTKKHVGDPITVENITAKAEALGYTFSDWSSEQVTVGADGTFKMPAKNVILTGSFEAIDYTVTYEFAEGTPEKLNDLLPEKVEGKHAGDEIKAEVIDALSRGYDFQGWKIDGKGDTVGTFEMPASNVTLIGSFKAKEDTKYTVKYFFETVNDATAAYAQNFELAKDETKTGTTDAVIEETDIKDLEKAFNGYTFAKIEYSSGEKPIIQGDGSLVINIYYDRDSYEVTYVIVGANADSKLPAVTVPAKKSYKQGAKVSVEKDLSAAGYAFSGWGTKADVAVKDGEFEMPMSNVEFIGVFVPITSAIRFEYRIASNVQKPSNWNTLVAALESYNGDYTQGEELTLPTLPKVSGYKFAEWQMEKDPHEVGPVERALAYAKELLVLKVSAAGGFKVPEYDAVVYSVVTRQTTPGPTPDDPTPTPTIPDDPTPTAAAPAGTVLGARREEANEAAVLGARRGRTDDETAGASARAFAIIISAAAAITLMLKGKKKEEDEKKVA